MLRPILMAEVDDGKQRGRLFAKIDKPASAGETAREWERERMRDESNR